MSPATATLDTAEELIRDTVRLVSRDVPEAHARYVDALADERLRLQIGDEQFTLRDGDVCAPDPHASVVVSISIHTLHDLINGRLALTEAVVDRSMAITGPTRSIAAVDRALQLLMHGVVRSPRAPELMRRLEHLAMHTSTNQSHPDRPATSKEPS